MLRLREATPHDLAILTHWDEQEHVAASDPNDDWNWETELARTPEWRQQFIAEVDGKPIGCVQIIDPAKEETHYWGHVAENKRAIDIWIGEKENLGKGYGTKMMNIALKKCFANENVTEVLIDPLTTNQKAIRFYRRLGFVFLEKRKFGYDECAVHAMSREQWLTRQ